MHMKLIQAVLSNMKAATEGAEAVITQLQVENSTLRQQAADMNYYKDLSVRLDADIEKLRAQIQRGAGSSATVQCQFVLRSYPDTAKINAIKVIRQNFACGLREGKQAIETPNWVIGTNVIGNDDISPSAWTNCKRELEALGAVVDTVFLA